MTNKKIDKLRSLHRRDSRGSAEYLDAVEQDQGALSGSAIMALL